MVDKMGSKVVRLDGNKKILTVDDTEYKLTSGLLELITNKHPRHDQWKPNDYQVYKSRAVQTNVRSFPNRTDGARPHATWKWKYVLKKMGEMIAAEEEGSEDIDDTDTTTSVGDTGESSNMLSDMLSSAHTRSRPLPPSPTHTRFHSLPICLNLRGLYRLFNQMMYVK